MTRWPKDGRSMIEELGGYVLERLTEGRDIPDVGDVLERTAPRQQCDDLHAHRPHSWRRPPDVTQMCPGRAVCDINVSTIPLRPLPPQEGDHDPRPPVTET